MLRRAAAVCFFVATVFCLTTVAFAGLRCLFRRGRTITGTTFARSRMRLARERAMRSRGVRLAAQSFFHCARSCRRRLLFALARAFGGIAHRLFPHFGRGRSFFRRRQFHPGTPRFRKADRDRLFRRARTVLAFADVIHFLADKFARLGRRRFSFALVFAGPFHRFFFWHNTNISRAEDSFGCFKRATKSVQRFKSG